MHSVAKTACELAAAAAAASAADTKRNQQIQNEMKWKTMQFTVNVFLLRNKNVHVKFYCWNCKCRYYILYAIRYSVMSTKISLKMSLFYSFPILSSSSWNSLIFRSFTLFVHPNAISFIKYSFTFTSIGRSIEFLFSISTRLSLSFSLILSFFHFSFFFPFFFFFGIRWESPFELVCSSNKFHYWNFRFARQ